MIASDMLLGLLVGAIQGIILRALFIASMRLFNSITTRILRSPLVTLIASTTLAIVLIGGFLILAIVAKPFIEIWSNYVTGWVIGFGVGAVAQSVSSSRRMR